MKNRDLTLIAILIAILIVCSQLALPIGPVPITLQTLAVLLIGYLLPPKNAFLATSIYLVMGLFGLPIFSNFMGGLQSFLMPSFGFALGFIPASYFQAKYLTKFQNLIVAGIINFTITYLIGLSYMAFILNIYLNSQLNFVGILMAGMIPFIPGDILKLVVGVILAKRLLPIIHQRVPTL